MSHSVIPAVAPSAPSPTPTAESAESFDSSSGVFAEKLEQATARHQPNGGKAKATSQTEQPVNKSKAAQSTAEDAPVSEEASAKDSAKGELINEVAHSGSEYSGAESVDIPKDIGVKQAGANQDITNQAADSDDGEGSSEFELEVPVKSTASSVENSSTQDFESNQVKPEVKVDNDSEIETSHDTESGGTLLSNSVVTDANNSAETNEATTYVEGTASVDTEKEAVDPAKVQLSEQSETEDLQRQDIAASGNQQIASDIGSGHRKEIWTSNDAKESSISSLSAGTKSDPLGKANGDYQTTTPKVEAEKVVADVGTEKVASSDKSVLEQMQLLQRAKQQLDGQVPAGQKVDTTLEPTDIPLFNDGARVTGMNLSADLTLDNGLTLQRVDKSQVVSQAMLSRPIPTERMASALGERLVMMVNTEKMTAEMQLDPPELGSLQVRIQMNGDQAQVQIQAQHSQARDMLEQSLPRLRQMLAEQGIQLAEADVRQGDNGAQSQHGQASGNDGVELLADNEVEPMVAQTLSNRNREGGIDFYA